MQYWPPGLHNDLHLWWDCYTNEFEVNFQDSEKSECSIAVQLEMPQTHFVSIYIYIYSILLSWLNLNRSLVNYYLRPAMSRFVWFSSNGNYLLASKSLDSMLSFKERLFIIFLK